MELYTEGRGDCSKCEQWYLNGMFAKSGKDEGNYRTIPMDINPSYVSGGPLKMAGFIITHQISSAH